MQPHLAKIAAARAKSDRAEAKASERAEPVDCQPTQAPSGDVQRTPDGPVDKALSARQKTVQLLGYDRSDVVSAVSRMGWRWGGKRELKKLPEHLYKGEQVRFIAQGNYQDHQGILVLTNLRL